MGKPFTPASGGILNVSSQFLEGGHGGIARAARLSILALQPHVRVEALSVQDLQDGTVGKTPYRSFGGNRLRFALANSAQIMKRHPIVYDFAGTARAHLPLLGRASPYAVWIHGTEVWGYPRPRRDYFSVVRNARLVLANSQFTLDRARENIGALPQARLCWLGTEDDREPEGRAPVDDENPSVLFVGRNDNILAKGQDILIDIWPQVVAAVPKARLIFAGGGSHLEIVRSLAHASPAAANIDVLGFVREDEMAGLWQRASLFAMLSHVEGFGLVFVEAMRHAKPVIASTDDASQEINLDGVTGYNAPRARPHVIAERIVQLLRNPDHARQLGLAGLDRWRQYFRFSAFAERFTSVCGAMPTSASSQAI